MCDTSVQAASFTVLFRLQGEREPLQGNELVRLYNGEVRPYIAGGFQVFNVDPCGFCLIQSVLIGRYQPAALFHAPS